MCQTRNRYRKLHPLVAFAETCMILQLTETTRSSLCRVPNDENHRGPDSQGSLAAARHSWVQTSCSLRPAFRSALNITTGSLRRLKNFPCTSQTSRTSSCWGICVSTCVSYTFKVTSYRNWKISINSRCGLCRATACMQLIPDTSTCLLCRSLSI